MLINGQVGPQTNADGSTPPLRQGKTGETNVGDLHGRFYEQNYRANLYTFGISSTALVAANAIATGLTATAQPIIGLYNPSTSTVNLVVLQARLVVTVVANTAVAPGGFMWVSSVGNTAVSTGSTPFNCKTLAASGSSAKAFAMSTALTGLTNNVAVLTSSALQPGLNAAGAATAVSVQNTVTVENLDGAIIVPPGGVLALMNQISTTTMSVNTSILWEEVAV